MSLDSFDLDLSMVIPPPKNIKTIKGAVAIAPIFSLEDNLRFVALDRRWDAEQQYQSGVRDKLLAYQQALTAQTDAEQDGVAATPPTAPDLTRPDDLPEYTMEQMEEDVLTLLLHIWRISEEQKPADQREPVTRERVQQTFTIVQAWQVLRFLWQRRFERRELPTALAQAAATTSSPAQVAATPNRASRRRNEKSAA